MRPETAKKIRTRGGKTTVDRFWEKVSIGWKGECWPWKGALDGAGYGDFKFGGRNTKAHRVSWELENGPIPGDDSYHGVCVLHKCDNPACVNPDHLFLGSHQENMTDRGRKDRHATGESSGRAKLSEDDVRAIRYFANTFSSRKLGEMYGVGHRQILNILHYKSWANVE